jgi:molecular chaperone GrpE (heat shock protein)
MEKEQKKKDKKYPEPIVGSLIINPEGKILLAKSKKWNKKYTVFGGHVEDRETLEDAVIRETKEEAGIDVKIISPLGFGESISEKDCYREKHFVFMDFLCEFDGSDEEIKLNGEYENDFKWFSLEEALRLESPSGTKRLVEAYREYLETKKYADSWKRCVADFENYKKRQKENAKDMIAFSNMNMILQVLPVLDNFHASTDHIPENQKKSPWVVGIMHIQKQLEKVLEDNGVGEIVVKEGDKFNPEIHEAIENKEAKNEKSKNIIKKVLMKGYKMGDRVIRATRVIVE